MNVRFSRSHWSIVYAHGVYHTDNIPPWSSSDNLMFVLCWFFPLLSYSCFKGKLVSTKTRDRLPGFDVFWQAITEQDSSEENKKHQHIPFKGIKTKIFLSRLHFIYSKPSFPSKYRVLFISAYQISDLYGIEERANIILDLYYVIFCNLRYRNQMYWVLEI